ncbi:phosphatidylinositol 4,5-bisphosphate 3-kinase catalytic subunit alpha isoform-like [Mauremys mutica]|uniref:phosphatidylinositol 4,5-bisphosphate 3-kinase catalytic subunit alpha isoform-like n=1 Tax=Mauremys mutica TaxID=74926 RepID=UPI001D156A02|nr:phosphatidylinositol 4,5-bisphosphate 3-kinase catalytic subunit alpha isoform-like [Mauremys mutica]
MALNLRPVPHGLEDSLNPIGVGGSNPNRVPGDVLRGLLATRHRATLLLSLSSLLRSAGLPERQPFGQAAYGRKAPALAEAEPEALESFSQRMNEAPHGGWSTKRDWIFHTLRHMPLGEAGHDRGALPARPGGGWTVGRGLSPLGGALPGAQAPPSWLGR